MTMGVAVRGALAAWTILALAGCMDVDTRPRISIEWGMYPEEFEGLEVVIDGEVAGKLEKFGAATRTAFPVAKGDHRVCVKHPSLECLERRVAAEVSGQRYMLLLEIEETSDSSGQLNNQLVLR